MMRILQSIGFYESIIIIVAFSAFVIITDEILHARAKKRREAQQGRTGH
jgi:hypothetical protein